MGYWSDYDGGDGEFEPDPVPSWLGPDLGPLPGKRAEDVAPRILPDNRRYRRDYDHGRSSLQRSLRRGFGLPWHGSWPPVWVWDVVPFLRMRRARSEQSMRWAYGVVVVSIESGDDRWTVTLPSRGERRGHHKDRRAVHRQRVDWTRRERQAAASCSALLSRRHVRIQPTHAP